MDQLKIESLRGSHPGTRILRLSGAFTLQGVFEFQSIFRSGADPVTLIDLAGVPYMDSAALGAICGVHTSSQAHQRLYALVGLSDRLHRFLEVGGVSGILVVYPSVEEAEHELESKVDH